MKNISNGVWGILIVTVSIIALSFFTRNHSKDDINDWLTTAPIFFLSQAQYELNAKNKYTCRENLYNAINSMKSLERYSSDDVKQYVDQSIFELYHLIEVSEYKNLNVSDSNLVIFHAINAVAYAELRISEDEFKNGKSEESLVLMKTVLVLLNQSINYIELSDISELEEISIISHVEKMVNKIKLDGHISDKEFDTINLEIEAVLNKAFSY